MDEFLAIAFIPRMASFACLVEPVIPRRAASDFCTSMAFCTTLLVNVPIPTAAVRPAAIPAMDLNPPPTAVTPPRASLIEVRALPNAPPTAEAAVEAADLTRPNDEAIAEVAPVKAPATRLRIVPLDAATPDAMFLDADVPRFLLPAATAGAMAPDSDFPAAVPAGVICRRMAAVKPCIEGLTET